jgi:hypothetical protein
VVHVLWGGYLFDHIEHGIVNIIESFGFKGLKL